MNTDSKTARRMSIAKGRRVSTISNPRSISRIVSEKRPDTKMSDVPGLGPTREKFVTVTLAYSTSVEKAFRRKYKTSFFGPLSGNIKRSEPILEVENLPQLYSDFVYINDLMTRNQEYARKLLEEVSESTEEPGKLLKLPKIGRSRKVSRTRENSISTPNMTKFPPIASNSASMNVSVGNSSTSTSDNAVQVG